MAGFAGLNRRQALAGAAATLTASAAKARNGQMGFKEDALRQLDANLAAHAAQAQPPGLVAAVERDGERHLFAHGRLSLDGPAIPRDAIFRIASMTKPFTAVAAMMLVEEGKLALDEPVDRLLPELADRRVLKTLASPLDETVPAARPITVEDVLTFRLGWGVLFEPDLPIQKAVEGVPGFGMPDPESPLTPDAYMKRLGELPLMAQPGERWIYTVGANVLGVLVARAAGRSLDVVFNERITGPLGLKDTAFWIPQAKVSRTTTSYMNEGGKLVLFDRPDGRYINPPVFPAGDSGLVSTAEDFTTFARFLTSGLAPDGRRLISEATLTEMRTNRLTPAQMADGEIILGPGWGWGLGLGVQVGESPYGIARGSYGWNGGFGTSWFTDPASGLIAVLLTQRVFDSPDPPPVHKDFWRDAVKAVA